MEIDYATRSARRLAWLTPLRLTWLIVGVALFTIGASVKIIRVSAKPAGGPMTSETYFLPPWKEFDENTISKASAKASAIEIEESSVFGLNFRQSTGIYSSTHIISCPISLDADPTTKPAE